MTELAQLSCTRRGDTVRWKAFFSLCAALVGGAYFVSLALADANGLPIPAFVVVILVIAIEVPLFLLNSKILDWRRSRGRDVEEEERYETEGGFITLHTNAKRDELLSRHYPDPDEVARFDSEDSA
jgi:hypothetical protein